MGKLHSKGCFKFKNQFKKMIQNKDLKLGKKKPKEGPFAERLSEGLKE